MNVASGSEKTPKNNIKQRLNIFGPDSPPQIFFSWKGGLRWFDRVFEGQCLPSLSINYVAINKDIDVDSCIR